MARVTNGLWDQVPNRMHGGRDKDIVNRLMLDSRVVDVRMVYTHHIPCPNPCQESTVADQYQPGHAEWRTYCRIWVSWRSRSLRWTSSCPPRNPAARS